MAQTSGIIAPALTILLLAPPVLAALACSDGGLDRSGGTTSDDDCADDTGAPMVCEEGLTLTVDSRRTLPIGTGVSHGPVVVDVGDLDGDGLPEVYVGTNKTATRLDGEGWTVATNIWEQPDDGQAVIPLIADLTGDGQVDLILGLPGSDGGDGQVVVFEGPVVDPVDWDDPHLELKGCSGCGAGKFVDAADHNGDGMLDLVVAGNQLAWVRFGPLESAAALGAAVDLQLVSTEDASLSRLLPGRDVDGDACVDLVFEPRIDSGDPCLPARRPPSFLPCPLSAGELKVDDASVVSLSDVECEGWLVDDIDQDDIGDLLCVNALDDAGGGVALGLFVHLGPLTSSAEPSSRTALFGWFLGVADFDADGDRDLLQYGSLWPLSVDGVESAVDIFSIQHGPVSDWPDSFGADCQVGVSETWAEPSPQGLPEAFWLGDLDGDGAADIVTATTAPDDSGLVQVVLSAE